MDEIRPTPKQYPMASMAADAVRGVAEFASKPFGYDNPPGEILSNVLSLPQIANTLDRVAYGEPLTTGSGQTTHLREDTIDAATALAPPIAKMARKAVPALRAGLGSETIYHSSPARFDKFDPSKIGSGEGNASFGHGLYFTDSKDVSKFYRQLSSSLTRGVNVGDDVVNAGYIRNMEKDSKVNPWKIDGGHASTGNVAQDVKIMLSADIASANSPDPVKSIRKTLENRLKENRENVKRAPEFGYDPSEYAHLAKTSEDRLKWLDANSNSIKEYGGSASSYSVKVANRHKAATMDFDKSMADQPALVRKAVMGLFGGDKGIINKTGQEAYFELAKKYGSPTEASKKLIESGVVGHKYRAGQLSERTSDSTNYVIYPGFEDRLKITGVE